MKVYNIEKFQNSYYNFNLSGSVFVFVISYRKKNFRQGCYFDLYCNFLRFDKIKITKGLVVFVDKDVLLKFILSNISQNM